ncbi:major facilitator superfamily domain-containing protein [Mycena belliarum]|uniref:Major facilitator superfamily domain-containing protein n=1 Tax=Mycena belliarum TaxID=1033014 RepID=A0AAD6UIV4_9AGAR|nr:major facilitator superfamily domain-containing protein [Mycena belliae]
MSPIETARVGVDPAAIRHEKSTTHDFGFIPIPRRLRYDPEKPFHFGLLLNVLFGFASTFIVANLYYCQPLLIQFSESFDVSYDRVARIPTLLQASYATGILLISPLGDLVRRRQLVILLASISASLTVGLAVTQNLVVFETLSFLIGVVSVTAQVLIPLAADLAPPERRAAAISTVFSGLLFGILVARVLAGIIAQFTSWRVVYYFAIGVQYLVLVASYFVIPDYPAKNLHMTYWGILRTMGRFAYTEPLLIQACFVNFASCAVFSNFWVTLTFLLGGPPYFYSTVTIGLFGLIGICGVACGPLVGRGIDGLVPWYASLAAALLLLCFQAVQVGAGDTSVVAVVVAIIGLDVFRQMLQMSLATAVFSISAPARARLNAVFVLTMFIGQLMGTAAGTQVFTHYGWRAAAALNLGWCAWIVGVLMLRGPHCARFTWFGFEGGWEARRSVVDARKAAAETGKDAGTDTDLEKGEMATPATDTEKGAVVARVET